MEVRTCNLYIITSLLLALVCLPAGAQSKPKEKEPAVIFPLYNGVTVGVDIFGLGSNLLGSDFLSSEVAVEVDLKHRFFPIVEIGYGKTDAFDEKGIIYKSSAPYFRIGMNYNTMFKKGKESFLYVGFRYAMSSFKYDIKSDILQDNIWGGTIGNTNLTDYTWGGAIVPYDHKGMKGSMKWLEFVVGVRAHIYKSFYMGWAIRYKNRLSSSADEYGDPWYVPGFGAFNSSKLGMTYSIIYKLPF